jgi:hypothetical protein
MKKIVLLLAMLSFAFQLTSCKLKKAQDDTEIIENADVEKIEAEDADLLAASNSDSNIGPVDDALQEALGENSGDFDMTEDPSAVASTETVATESEPMDVAAAPELDESSFANTPPPDTEMTATNSVPEGSAVTEMAPVESSMDTAMDTTSSVSEVTEAPVLESPASEPSSLVYTPETTTVAETPAPVKAAVKPSASGVLRKIAETSPYQHGDGWVNTVYIARPKESLNEISQTIYGMDKSSELKKLNSYLAARSPKAGDKIYYVSPNRPSDSLKTLSFYEDTGMASEIYTAKKGDDLKKVSKNLLGYSDAYKEVWSTNSIATKGSLRAGDTLRYWKPSVTSAPTVVAQNTVSQPEPAAQVIESVDQLPSQPIAQNNFQETAPPPQAEMTPPPPAEMTPPPMENMNQTPPPTDDMSMAQNSMPQGDLPPPPPDMGQPMDPVDAAALTPPPSADIAAEPVPPTQKAVTPNTEEEQSIEGMSSDTTMMLGGVIVLCALMAFALIRRNKKKKEFEMASMSETNVGS